MHITIVTPSYNQAQYLEYSIQSVLSQVRDLPAGTDLEYILVDGGSTDGSLDIIHRYADKLTWWVSEPDHGQAEAINKGFSHASGELFGWLNSDDLLLPGAIASAVTAFTSHPEAGLIYGDALTIDANGKPIKELRFQNWGYEDLAAFRIICQPAVFFRRETWEKTGGMDPSYHFMLDHHLWLKMGQHATICKADNQKIPWAAARNHASAKNVNQAARFGQETLRLLDWMNTQPGFTSIIEKKKKTINAGAYRLNARYLLDGAMPGPALRSYLRALVYDPIYTLKHWHRILFACASLVGLQGLADGYFREREKNRPDISIYPGIQDWPGIKLFKA